MVDGESYVDNFSIKHFDFNKKCCKLCDGFSILTPPIPIDTTSLLKDSPYN